MAYNQRRTSASNVILLPLRLVRSAATSLRSPTASRAGTPTPRHPPQRRHLSLPLLSTLSNPQPQRRGIWKITGVLFAPFRRTSAGAISNSSDVNEDEIGDDLLLEDEASDKTKHKEFLEKRHGKKINLDKPLPPIPTPNFPESNLSTPMPRSLLVCKPSFETASTSTTIVRAHEELASEIDKLPPSDTTGMLIDTGFTKKLLVEQDEQYARDYYAEEVDLAEDNGPAVTFVDEHGCILEAALDDNSMARPFSSYSMLKWPKAWGRLDERFGEGSIGGRISIMIERVLASDEAMDPLDSGADTDKEDWHTADPGSSSSTPVLQLREITTSKDQLVAAPAEPVTSRPRRCGLGDRNALAERRKARFYDEVDYEEQEVDDFGVIRAGC